MAEKKGILPSYYGKKPELPDKTLSGLCHMLTPGISPWLHW